MTDLAAILSGFFAGGTVPSTLYIGLVSSDNFISFDPLADSMGSHSGWEEVTDIDESTRPDWTPGSVVGSYPASVSNPSGAFVTPSIDGTAIGVFLCDDNTIGGTTGQLYGPWFFDEGPRDMIAGTPFKIEVEISLKSNTSVVN